MLFITKKSQMKTIYQQEYLYYYLYVFILNNELHFKNASCFKI